MRIKHRKTKAIEESEVFSVQRMAVPDSEMLAAKILRQSKVLGQEPSARNEISPATDDMKGPANWIAQPWWTLPATMTALVAGFMFISLAVNTLMPAQLESEMTYEELYLVSQSHEAINELVWQDVMLLQDELALLDL